MRAASVMVLGWTLQGCGLAPYADPPASPTTGDTGSAVPGRACPPDSGVTWDNFAERFFQRHCTECHSAALEGAGERSNAPDTVDLDTREQVQRWTLRIYARSADDNASMPPGGGTSARDRVELGDWLACGAP